MSQKLLQSSKDFVETEGMFQQDKWMLDKPKILMNKADNFLTSLPQIDDHGFYFLTRS